MEAAFSAEARATARPMPLAPPAMTPTRSRNLAWALPQGLGRGSKRHARPFPPAVYVLTGQKMATHGSIALPCTHA